jgi:hypothetical protein
MSTKAKLHQQMMSILIMEAMAAPQVLEVALTTWTQQVTIVVTLIPTRPTLALATSKKPHAAENEE